MRKTRNLFLISGARDRVALVLKELNFKGLITAPLGTCVDNKFLNDAFSKNKSVACFAGDYVDFFDKTRAGSKEDVYNIYVSSNVPYGFLQAIFLQSDEPVAEQFAHIVKTLGCNIGDHRSNISNANGDGPTIESCAYCRYLKGDAGDNNRTIYMSDHFFVLATVGQFVNGYLLIIPKRHIMSNAELTDEELEEFTAVLEDVEYLLKLTYSEDMFLVWENGSGRDGKSKAKDSVVHSHVHIVASMLTAEEVEETSKLDFKDITLKDLKNYADVSYLLMRSEKNHDVWKICPSDDVFIPRQWIRNEVAEKIGITDETWNWRKYPFYDNMQLTVNQIRDAIIDNWDVLSERIRENVICLF